MSAYSGSLEGSILDKLCIHTTIARVIDVLEHQAILIRRGSVTTGRGNTNSNRPSGSSQSRHGQDLQQHLDGSERPGYRTSMKRMKTTSSKTARYSGLYAIKPHGRCERRVLENMALLPRNNLWLQVHHNQSGEYSTACHIFAISSKPMHPDPLLRLRIGGKT